MTTKKTDDTVAKLPELTDAERTAAEKEGLKEAYAQSARTQFSTQSATEAPEYVGDRWPGRHEIMQWAHLVNLGLVEFKKTVAADAENPIAEDKVAGLLELERSGQNRTEYVDALCKRLGVKSPLEVTNSGPGHTNDVSAVSVVPVAK